jgi:hypothetical protein
MLRTLKLAVVVAMLASGLAMTLTSASLASAQTVGNANIRGRVTDETGATLPGVTVTATSPSLQVGQQVVISDADGTYRIAELPIGEYRVSYELQGFQGLVREGVRLTAGFSAEINVALKVGALAETITVSGQSPVVDTTAAAPIVNLSNQFLTEVLPVTRRIQDILATTPGMSTRFSADLGGGTSGGGAYTNYGITGQSTMLMDGVNTRQDSTIDQGTGNGPDVGTIEEMQIVTVGGGAEQALPGVFLNMIVKSGGNQFHGRYEVQSVSDRFQSSNVTDDLRKQGVTVGDAFKGGNEGSADIGGRFLRDRWWFYAAGRYRKTERTALGFSKAPGPDGVFMTADDEPATRKSTDWNRTAKSTYLVTPRFRVVGFGAMHYELFDPYPDLNPRLTPYPGSRRFTWTPNQSKAELQGTLSPRLMFDVLVGRQQYMGKYRAQESAPDAPRTFDNVTQLSLGPAIVQDTRPRQSWGPSGTLSYAPSQTFLGRHELKAGFAWMYQTYSTGRPNGKHGNYQLIFDTINGVPHSPSQIQTFNFPLAPQNRLNEGGMFVQDTWRVGTRTTLNLGLRYDSFHSWVPPQTKEQGQFGTSGSYSRVEAITWHEVAPRFGIAYDITGDTKTVIKATLGKFNTSPGDSFAEFYNKNTITTTTYRWSDPNKNGDYDPGEVNLDTTCSGCDFISITGGAANTFLNPDLVDPQVYEGTVTLDRELMADLGARVSYIYVRQADLFGTVNVLRPYALWNVVVPRVDPGPDGTANTADDGGMVNVYGYAASVSSSAFTGNKRLNRPSDRDVKQQTIEAVLTKRSRGPWGMLGSVAFSKNDRPLVGIIQTPNDEYFDRDTTWDWNAKITGNYQLPLRIDLSGTYQLYNGVKGQRTNLFRTVASAGNVTLRLEPYGTQKGPVRDLLNLRVARNFKLGIGQIRTSVEILNALNVANPWDISYVSGPTFGQWGTIDSPRIARFNLSFTF